MSASKPSHVGIVVKQRADGRTVYQAAVWSARDGKRIRRSSSPSKRRRRGATTAKASSPPGTSRPFADDR